MSTLEIPKSEPYQDDRPAEKAGVFLEQARKTYNLFNPEVNEIAEAAAKTISLEKAGRYISTVAIGNFVTIFAIPDEQGEF